MNKQNNQSNLPNPNIRVGTIRVIHQALIDSGYRISEGALRSWVKTGILPAVYNGSVAYISYENVIRLLTEPMSSAS